MSTVLRRLALAATLLPGVARADDFCVGTPTEFLAALEAIAAQPGSVDNRILVRSGTLDFGTTGLVADVPNRGSLLIRGGYGVGCAAAPNFPSTTLSGGGTRQLRLVFEGDVTLEGFRFENWKDEPSVGVDVGVEFATRGIGRRLTLRGNVLRDNEGQAAIGIYPAGELVLRENLIHDNRAGYYCTMLLKQDSRSAAPIRLVHNTYAHNDSALCLNTRSPHTVLVNNILWDNDVVPAYGNDDLNITGVLAPILLLRNLIGDFQAGISTDYTEIGTLTADPQFTNPAAFDFSLVAATSPAANAGVPGVPGGLSEFDLVGQLRRVGPMPDLGALESVKQSAFDYLVTNTNDAGPGSLRAAIDLANAGNEPTRIGFAIGTGCGPRTIALQSPLPVPTVPLLIDGYTQSGASPNTFEHARFDATTCIVLSRGNLNANRAFDLPAEASAPLELRGLAFSGFDFAAVRLLGGAGHALHGNQFGGLHEAGGDELGRSNFGVLAGFEARGVSIGGERPAQANWFPNATTAGVALTGERGFGSVSGNLFGARVSGDNSSNANPGVGLRIVGSGWRVHGNQVGSSGQDGVLLIGADARFNLIDGNRIGVGPDGQNVANVGAGVRITAGASDNVVGADGASNLVAFNETGVWIEDGARNRVIRNVLVDSAGWVASQELDLGAPGPDANDADDADTGPGNAGQNHPEPIGFEVSTAGFVWLDAALPGADGLYTIDVVRMLACEPGMPPQSSIPVAVIRDVGFGGLTPGGVRRGLVPLGPLAVLGDYIAVSATDAEGNTSEFSPCIALPEAAPLLADGFESVLE